MKKAIYILFTLYFVALLVAPCGDEADCNDTKQSELCRTEHREHQDENHQDESCTPFCVCSCCAAHFLRHDVQPLMGQVSLINSAYIASPNAETSSAIIPVWQPPKLS